MKIVAISDTHDQQWNLEVPDGDVLVHAGDICFEHKGSVGFKHITRLREWLYEQPHKHKVIIAGNHDFPFETHPKESRYILRDFHYLQDSAVEIDGVKFWGSPWQPWFYDWAFNLERGKLLEEKWALIPEDTDVLLTHGPPYGKGDLTTGYIGPQEHAGCKDLTVRLQELSVKLHVFGHIHSGYGMYRLGETDCVNASVVNEHYEAVNKPVTWEYR